MMPNEMYDLILLALCCWREAQNQPKAAQIAQCWSVRNRVERPNFWNWGDSYSTVILKPEQYSSFNRRDPNSTKFPHPSDPAWQQCLSVAQDVYQGTYQDLTEGCTHYYDASLDSNPPEWAKSGELEHVVDYGQLRFWRVKPLSRA